MTVTCASNFLVQADIYSSYIPIASTVTNLLDLFLKYVVLPRLSQETITQSHYYTYLQDKSFLRCIALLVPILGNIVVWFYDNFHFDRWNDREYVLAQVQQQGGLLGFASDALKNDPEIVRAAFRQDSNALQFAGPALRNDREFMLTIVQQNGFALFFASGDLRNDRDFMLAAIALNGAAVTYASGTLRHDPQFMSAAIQRNPLAQQYVNTPIFSSWDDGLPLHSAI